MADQPDSEQAGTRPGPHVSRRVALGGGVAGLAAALLAACGGGGTSGGGGGTDNGTTGTGTATTANDSSATGVFGNSRSYKFTVVNHATGDSCFVPTQNGAADACSLLGCSYQWTGATSGNVDQMLSAIDTAVTDQVDGIATTLTDPEAFNGPVADAIGAGVPVIAYGCDVVTNPRLAYIGEDLDRTGLVIGDRIAQLLPGGGEIVVFASLPGSPVVQGRLAGIAHALASHPAIHHRVVASGPNEATQLTTIQSFVAANRHYAGYFAADAGSTAAVAQAIQQNGLRARHALGGGCGLNVQTQQLLAAGQIEFTTDQQQYLQGFLAILSLYLHRVSDRLVAIADADTGVRLVDRTNIGEYAKTKSRFEGTSSSAGVQSA